MRYWWVNQNQTYRQEIPGGYLWSPKRSKGQRRNPFYEFMREVAPGDLIFAFAETRIQAWGRARSFAYEAPQPEEFGSAGRNWELIGWRVDVEFFRLSSAFRPADWIERLRPLLPQRYSPLLRDGRGVQAIYLTELPTELALVLADLIGHELGAVARHEVIAESAARVAVPEVIVWEEHIRRQIEGDAEIPPTEKEALVLARRGQGRFRDSVLGIERNCRITRVDRPELLRASHIKPWRDSTNAERIDGSNGLMLTPSIDHLFDRGFISFESRGRLLVSPVAHRASLEKMGVRTEVAVDVGPFTPEQTGFLEFHRDSVFLRSTVRRPA